MLRIHPPGSIMLHKRLGQTPLEAIEAWRREHPAYADVPMTYAGRLDPMAEGSLLVLLGDECAHKDGYLGLDKEYEIEVLLDLTTDTKDVLGMPSYVDAHTLPARDVLRGVLRAETGAKTVPYPPYSSKTVCGKPLFLHALEGTLADIEIPTHVERIYRIQDLGNSRVHRNDLRQRIMAMLAHAPRSTEPSKGPGADFRQDGIRAAWERLFDTMPDREFTVLRLRVTCASGTYMRSLAERIGTALGTGGMALSIRRTRIGTYVPFPGLWTRTLT